MNVGWLLTRLVIGFGLLSLIVYSQYFWYRGLWRLSSNWGSTALRVTARLLCLALATVSALAIVDGIRMGSRHWIPRGDIFPAFVGMWFTCAFFGFLAVQLVRGLERIWRRIARKVAAKKQVEASPAPAVRETAELVADPGRRHFFKAATAAAGKQATRCG